MVVVAVDADETGTVDLGVEDLCGFEVGGNEDAGLEAEAGGLSGDGVGEVAGGGAADGLEAEPARVGEGDRDDAALKLRVGKQTASFLTYRLVAPTRLPRFIARTSGVKPTGRSGWKPSGMGRRAT